MFLSRLSNPTEANLNSISNLFTWHILYIALINRLQILCSRKLLCTTLYRQLKYLSPYQFIYRRPRLQYTGVINEQHYFAIHRDKVR